MRIYNLFNPYSMDCKMDYLSGVAVCVCARPCLHFFRDVHIWRCVNKHIYTCVCVSVCGQSTCATTLKIQV